jgi:hypothetical protein
MSWWKVAWQTDFTDWTYGLLRPSQVAGGTESLVVPPNGAYMNVVLRSMRIPFSRRGWTRYAPAVHCFSSLQHKRTGRVSFHAVSTPTKLKDLDPKRLARVEMGEARLLGPVPYRGGDMCLEIGLFSVATDNMAAPYLGLLERVAGVAGVSFSGAAAPLVEAVREGLDALFTNGDAACLEIGLVNTFTQVVTGHYVLARAPKGELPLEELGIDSDGRLTRAGTVLHDVPYLVFHVGATERRDDWFDIPELRTAYDNIQDVLASGDASKGREALGAFRLRALMSADLLAADAQRIVGLVQKDVNEILDGAPVKASAIDANRTARLRPLEHYATINNRTDVGAPIGALVLTPEVS